MAKNSMEILNKAGIKPKLALFQKDERGIPRPTGAKTLIFVEDKLKKGVGENGEEVFYVKYYFKDEDGNEFEYKCKMHGKDGDPHYLVQKMASIEEGTKITLEGKTGASGSYISVTKEGEEEVVDIEPDEDY